ncbi:WD40 repeat domain-containing protein [Nautilia lithotrophica]
MKKEKIKEFKEEISYIKINENGFVVIDKENRVYVFDKNFKLINGFKIKLPPNKPSENGIDVDEGFNYLLLASPGSPLTLWDIKNKKLIDKYEWHKGDVLSVAFGNGYFASGGVDGKIFLYSLDFFKMVSKAARHKDFISDITFGEDEIYATSYDKSVLFINQFSFKKTARYLHLKKAVKINNTDFLISASEYADIIKWDKDTKERKDRFDLYDEFRDFYIYENYVFIAVKNKIVLYDLEKEVLINEKFFEIDADKIAVFNDRLYFSKENVLECVELCDEVEFLDLILKEDYKKAYEMVMLNPFLKKTKSFEKLEFLYKSSLKKAVKYLESGLKAKAIEVLKPFMNVFEKREEVTKTISHFENIIKFKKAYENRNLALFYQLANKYELLKNTKYYKLIEKEWELKFEKAKNLAIEGRVSEAKEILKDFLSVSEKLLLIELLLKEAELFRILREKIAKKDFKGFFAIIKEHPELKNSKEYKAVEEYAQRLYALALKAFEEENFNYVLKAAAILEDIEGYELKAKELTQRAQIALEFLRIFGEDKNRAFELVEKYPFLKRLKVYKIYEEKWHKRLKTAEKEAFEGKIKSALNTLKEYENIQIKRPRIKNMLKSAYLNYIKKSHDKNAIDKYLKIFGKDDEIAKITS